MIILHPWKSFSHHSKYTLGHLRVSHSSETQNSNSGKRHDLFTRLGVGNYSLKSDCCDSFSYWLKVTAPNIQILARRVSIGRETKRRPPTTRATTNRAWKSSTGSGRLTIDYGTNKQRQKKSPSFSRIDFALRRTPDALVYHLRGRFVDSSQIKTHYQAI